MVRTWSEITCPFDTPTKNSNTKGVQIGTYVMDKLSGVNGVPALRTLLKPKYDDYIAAFDAFTNQESALKSKTQEVNDMLDGLIPAAREWDLAVQTKYASKGTPDYTRVLPEGRKSFYSGKRDLRIRAINQFGLRIAGITALAATKSNADNYYTALQALIADQRDEMLLLDIKRKDLETARVALCEALDEVLDGLKQLFPNDLEKVAYYFPLDLIRRVQQKSFTGTVAAGTTKTIVQRKQKPNSLVKLKNTGLSTLHFYLAATKNGPIAEGQQPVVVSPGQAMTVPATTLGNIDNPYLTVHNPSEMVEGDYEVGL